MSISAVIIAAAVVAGTGLVIGLFLGFAATKFYVPVDEREEKILDALPGNNCGGCGYPGCSGLAAAIAKGEAPVNQCPVGGAPVADVIAGIMGTTVGETEKKVAYVNCSGTADRAKEQYVYSGEMSCKMASLAPGGGSKACAYGCLGYGDCVDVCEFNALHIVNGIAWVDKETCVACGKCVQECPRHLIDLVPYKQKYFVACSSQEKGRDVMKVCDIGCIACHKCEKVCHFDAIHVENNIAKIDYEKCKNCGLCAKECPKHVIFKIVTPPAAVKKETA
jgi:electron transport complex protein RnfB